MSINSPGGYKINIIQCKDSSNTINDREQNKDKKEKKIKINLDAQNKSAYNLNKSLRKPYLKKKRSFNKIDNLLNLENQEKLNKSNRSFMNIENNLEFPKSSLNIKNALHNKSFMNGKNSPSNVVFSEGNVDNSNKSYHYKGKLNQTKINFLNLINPNHNNKFFSKNKCSNIFNKDLIEALEGDSLNLIQQNLQNKIFDMGKETEFLEFGNDALEKSLFNLRSQRKKLTVKRTKKEPEKEDLNSVLKRHKTVIHKKKTLSNLVNSSSEDLLSDDKSVKLKNNLRKKSSKKLLNNLNINVNSKLNFNKSNLKKSNKHLNNLGNKYYKINVMNNLKDGRRSSVNHFLRSTHSFKKSTFNRSKTANHSKIASSIKEKNISSINENDIEQKEIKRRKGFNAGNEKFRILTQKKLVYDSLDDEELAEDAVFDNFYLNPDDKIIYLIDGIILFLTFWGMIYFPLNLVLNNCDIKDTISSLNFENIAYIFIDLLFICDLIINFFKSFYNFDEQLVTKSEKIFIHYIKGYFIIDLISAIPYYSIIKIIAYKNHKNMIMPVKCTKYYNHEINDTHQMLLLLKLIKLIKCISNNNIVSNYISNELNEIPFFENWSFLLSNILILLLVLHLTACMHIFVASTTFPNWIIQKELQTSPFLEVYLGSVYFLITTVTSVGYGDIIGNSFTEIIFQIFLLMIGIIAYSWLISSLSNYVQENNKQNEAFNQKISLLNEIKLEHPQMPKELYDKIHLHLEYINLGQKKDKSSLINFLPHTIQKSLLYEMYKPIIENFNFFKDFKNSEFVNRVISKLKPVLAVKNDLLLEQDEIIEDTIFVKQGRLSLEVKIDAEHPEKSVEKLLNEEYFFGIENNEVYQKSTFGGVFNMTVNNTNQSIVNKKNLYNLYSGNTINDNNHKRIKSIITNTNGENEILKHSNINTNYIHLRILDIRKNEHFGALLMFLNKRSPLILRVKTKKAELFFLKKIDAVEISTSYPNIWKRVNKKSFHNLKEIKRIMKNIIKHFCETYGIDFDFGSKIYNNLSRININELNKKIIPDLNSNRRLGNKFNIFNNRLMDLRRGSVDVSKAQLKMFQHFPKQKQTIILTKTNKEKDIEELVPEKFEINNRLYINRNTINNRLPDFNGEKLKSNVNEKKDNPIDCDLSMIQYKKKETIYGYGNQLYKKDTNIDSSQNNLNISIINSNGNINNLDKTKKSNLESKGNNLNNQNIPKKIQYGEEEKSNLMKFFGTPYYPEDINDEIYQGEHMFDSISQIKNSEQEYSKINNQVMSYSIEKNSLSNLQNNLINPIQLNNEKANNLTINNNFYTHNIFNNYNNNKISIDSSLNIQQFNFNINGNINKKKLQIFQNSFQISKQKNLSIKNKSSNHLKMLKTDTKNLNNKSKNLNIKNNDFFMFKYNKSHNNINYTKTINKISNKKSETYSSDCSSINYESDSNDNDNDNDNNNNNNENIFECENQIKNTSDIVKTIKLSKPNLKNTKNNNIDENKNKLLKIKSNIKINIKPSYINLNEITEGKFAKSKGLQNCIKNIVIKKILKHKKESQVPKKRKSLGVNRKSMHTLKKLQTLNFGKKQIQSPKRRKSFCATKKIPQSPKKRRSFSINKREIQSPKKRRSFSINKREAQTPKKRTTQISSKLLKNKTLAKNFPKRFNNIKININNNDKIKKTEVKSKFNMISDIHDKSSGINNIMKKSDQNILSSNSSDSTPRRKKNNDAFLLDYVNRNIKDDNTVLNNPGKFYNGLFGAIMKKVNKGKMKQINEE